MERNNTSTARIVTAGLAVAVLALLLAVMAAPAAADVPTEHDNVTVDSDNSTLLVEAEINDSALEDASEAHVALGYADPLSQSYEETTTQTINASDFGGANSTWVSHRFENVSSGNFTAFASVGANGSTVNGTVEQVNAEANPGSQGPITGLLEGTSDQQVLIGVVVVVVAIIAVRELGDR